MGVQKNRLTSVFSYIRSQSDKALEVVSSFHKGVVESERSERTPVGLSIVSTLSKVFLLRHIIDLTLYVPVSFSSCMQLQGVGREMTSPSEGFKSVKSSLIIGALNDLDQISA